MLPLIFSQLLTVLQGSEYQYFEKGMMSLELLYRSASAAASHFGRAGKSADPSAITLSTVSTQRVNEHQIGLEQNNLWPYICISFLICHGLLFLPIDQGWRCKKKDFWRLLEEQILESFFLHERIVIVVSLL